MHCLRAHADVFAWTHDDMPGIDPEVACHRLAIKKGARPVRKKNVLQPREVRSNKLRGREALEGMVHLESQLPRIDIKCRSSKKS